MTPTRICMLLQIRFGESAEVSHFERKPWFLDERMKQSWRDHLKSTFEKRIACANARIDMPTLQEAKALLLHMEAFTPEKSLFSFSASSRSASYSGWAIDDEIIFCLISKNEDQGA